MMLLYAKVAPPKVPKKRSRAGCTQCKEKKKKCNEERPQCQRCADKHLECIYEPIKPRQRRRQGSRDPLGSLSPMLQRSSLDLAFHNIDALYNSWADDTSLPVAEVDVPAAQEPLVPADMTLFSPDVQTAFDEHQLGGRIAVPDAADDTTREVSQELVLTNKSRREEGPRPLYLASAATTGAAASPTLPAESPYLEFVTPLYSEFASQFRRRALVDHFSNVLSRLIVLNEDSGNPFQRHVLPLCQGSDAVQNAVYALASAHREYRGLPASHDCESSEYFYNQAIQGITRLIERGPKVNRNELLAAIMLLVYFEVLVKDGPTNIVNGHLKGAMSVLNANEEGLDDTGAFLERAFRFYEVIAALSFGTAPLSKAPEAAFFSSGPTDRGSPTRASNVDTLLGMASTLWPILHKLSTLLPLKKALEAATSNDDTDPSLISELQGQFETAAYAVDVALKKWKPNVPPRFYVLSDAEESGSDGNISTTAGERAQLQSVLNNALAYQHSAIVYLHRTIYEHSRHHALVQRHAHVSLTHCVATVRNGGPMGALLWPLFVAACEAMSPGDRDLARQAFMAIGRRQGMVNIERAWFITQEVWRRADAADEACEPSPAQHVSLGGNGVGSSCMPIFKGRDLWRRISEEMGVTIVLG